MIQKIVDTLIERQSQNYEMTDDDEQIYRYGYILLCEVILNLIIALIVGVVFSKVKEVLFFLGVYIPLRSFCGGWHADRIWKCTLISNGILLLQIYAIGNIIKYLRSSVMFAIFFFNMLYIFLVAPVEIKEKQINWDEKRIYRKKIKLILAINLLIMVFVVLFDVREFVFTMMFIYIIQSIMLVLEIMKQKRLYIDRRK
ncbi:MAG: accessory gene regulator B family protein [Clostridiales bacterium]|nr:accessory gene regulator B family protein [Clostridiales bacterium]